MRFWLLSQNFWFSAILLYSFRFNAVFIFCHISKKSALLRGHFHLVRTFFGPIMRTNRGLTVRPMSKDVRGQHLRRAGGGRAVRRAERRAVRRAVGCVCSSSLGCRAGSGAARCVAVYGCVSASSLVQAGRQRGQHEIRLG